MTVMPSELRILLDKLNKIIELPEYQNEEINNRKKGWQALDEMANHKCECKDDKKEYLTAKELNDELGWNVCGNKDKDDDDETERILDKCCMEKSEDIEDEPDFKMMIIDAEKFSDRIKKIEDKIVSIEIAIGSSIGIVRGKSIDSRVNEIEDKIKQFNGRIDALESVNKGNMQRLDDHDKSIENLLGENDLVNDKLRKLDIIIESFKEKLDK